MSLFLPTRSLRTVKLLCYSAFQCGAAWLFWRFRRGGGVSGSPPPLFSKSPEIRTLARPEFFRAPISPTRRLRRPTAGASHAPSDAVSPLCRERSFLLRRRKNLAAKGNSSVYGGILPIFHFFAIKRKPAFRFFHFMKKTACWGGYPPKPPASLREASP